MRWNWLEKLANGLESKNMIKNLFINWRTTSTGATLIVGGIIHLIYAIAHRSLTESDCTTTVLAVLAGIGFIAAGDAKASQAASTTNSDAINKINALGSDPDQAPIKTP